MGLNSVKELLLRAAAVREDVVDIDGEKVHVREVGALEFAEYGRLLKDRTEDGKEVKGDRVRATATLIAACVLDGPGGNPALTIEDATAIARSARVSMPIVRKVMELSGFGDDEDDEKEPDAS